MGPPSVLPPQLVFFNTFLFLFFFILCFPQYHFAIAEEQFSACEPFRCGNIATNFSYPFWSDSRPDFCGHPKFKLDCKGDNATIKIASQNFHVMDVNSDKRTLTIARTDFLGTKCTNKFDNITLDYPLFNYTSNDVNSTILYDCNSLDYPIPPPLNLTTVMKFNCSISGNPRKAYFSMIGDTWFNQSALGCGISMRVPVLGEAARIFLEEPIDPVEVIGQGFDVEWKLIEEGQCEDCRNSGGRCGYNVSVGGFTCFCPSQSYDQHGFCFPDDPVRAPTPEPVQKQRELPIEKNRVIVGAVTATLVMLVMLTLFYFYQRRKKTGYATSYIQSRTASSVSSVIVTAAPVARAIGLLVFCRTVCSKIKSWGRIIGFCKTSKVDQNIEAFIRNHGSLALTRYKFADIKKMANSFKEKLGEGGYGSVYKGKLLNGHPVAVKLLKESKENGEDFINEVASISRTSHVNVVSLLGFCFEGKRKALIYEYMSNGSLDKFIHSNANKNSLRLTRENLYQIAIGIARGLEYLHRGCTTRILHFDIKPHNILLDESFCPKISDFGLAKLCLKKESIISISEARGTIGYLAPEVWNRNIGGVSYKSDVYSYGMMLLDMVEGRNNMNVKTNCSTDQYFPDYIYDLLEHDNSLRCIGANHTGENDIAKRMTIVGLWCIQTFPSQRPTMSKVIEMLERRQDLLEMPPKPVMPSPPRLELESSSTTTNTTT